MLEYEGATVGALVSTVDEVRTVDATQIQEPPAGSVSDFMDAVITIDDRLIMMLNARNLVTYEELAAWVHSLHSMQSVDYLMMITNTLLRLSQKNWHWSHAV